MHVGCQMCDKLKISMMKNLSRIFVIVVCGLLAVSCSEYSKLLKSKDFDGMYAKAIEYYDAEKYTRAADLLEAISPYYSGSLKEDTVTYFKGAARYKMGDFISSETIFDEFRRQFGRSVYLEDAEYMYAMGFYFSSPGPERDQTATLRAITAINEYLGRYPESEKKDVCNERLAELEQKLHDQAYLNAMTYLKIGYHQSAVIALQNALDKYPRSTHREELLFRIVEANYEYASNSRAIRQVDRYLNTLDAYYNLIAEFPESKFRREADRMYRVAKRFLDRRGVSTDEQAEDTEEDVE